MKYAISNIFSACVTFVRQYRDWHSY